jgi:hypothetical protein
VKRRTSEVEIMHPADNGQSQAALERLVKLVADRLSTGQAKSKSPEEMTTAELTEEVLAQPWMLPRSIASTILRMLPVSHQNKYSYRYEDYGCFRCGTKDVPHQSLSLCSRCYGLLYEQIKAGIVNHARREDLSPAQLAANLTRSSDNARRILAEVGAVAKTKSKHGRQPGSLAALEQANEHRRKKAETEGYSPESQRLAQLPKRVGEKKP